MRAYNVNDCIKSYIIKPEIIGDNNRKSDKSENREKYEFLQKCFKSNVKNIRIHLMDKTDRMLRTRTEQLALPKARHLNELKNREAFKNFELNRKSQVNRIYRKSHLSLYSRLANIRPEEEPERRQQWDKKTKMRINKRLKKLAKPKKDFSVEKPKNPPKGNCKLSMEGNTPNPRRLAKLSRPRKYAKIETNNWCLTKALQYYKPTQRILQLSKPRQNESQVKDEMEAHKVQPQALLYKATERIKELAVPQKINTKAIDKVEDDPFKINPKALKAVITKRIEELAAPKEYSDYSINENPYKVSKSALKAKASARIKELSQPRKIKSP